MLLAADSPPFFLAFFRFLVSTWIMSTQFFCRLALRGGCKVRIHSSTFSHIERTVQSNNIRTHKRILQAARWIALALSVHTLALAALAQSPLPDSLNPGANGPVNSMAVQADGKILVAGGFNTLGGESRTNIGRLNADGTLDTSFNPGADSSVVS